MENLIDIIDKYYNQMGNPMFDKVSEELLGAKYIINESIGQGTISRISIEKGIELSIWESSSNISRFFDNREFQDNILEISYCYSGGLIVDTYPCRKTYKIKKDELCFYKMTNKVDYFKFEYEKFSGISIYVDLDIIKENLNPICICRAKALEELEEFLDEVFIEDILIIDKAPYNIRILVEEIKNISLQNMIDYMEIKAKAMGLLVTSLQYKTNTLNLELKFTREEINTIYKGEAILLKNLQNPPSVSELAKELNITVYKLQKGFKEIIGNTVYEHIKRLRIEKSKKLLKNTSMSIIEVANEVGYENPSKFSSVFKSYMNMTPSEYRLKY